MSHPIEPDWRRMPASAVPVKATGPEFVRLRAEDARRYADDCIEQADATARTARIWSEKADAADEEAMRWEAAAAAFAEAWGSDDPTPAPRLGGEREGESE